MYHSFHQTTIASTINNNTSNSSNLIAKHHHQQKHVPSKQVQQQQQINSQKEFTLSKYGHYQSSHHHHHQSTYHQQLLLAHSLENNANSSNSKQPKKSNKKKKNRKKEVFLDSVPLHDTTSSPDASKPQTPAKETETNIEEEENSTAETSSKKEDSSKLAEIDAQDLNKQEYEICVICHGPLPSSQQDTQEEVAECSPCEHQFCYSCIKKWCLEYCSECPMCKTHIDKLVIGNRKEEVQEVREEFIEKKEYQFKREETAIDHQTEFACLDHHYFLGEIEVLLNQVIHIHSSLKMTNVQFSSNFRLQSKAKNNHQRKYTKISEIKDTLVTLQLEMRRMHQNIDPVVLMQQLYQIQESLSEFSDHHVHDTIVQQQQHHAYMYHQQNPYTLQENNSRQRVLYSEEDCYDDYEDEYSEQSYWEEDSFYRRSEREVEYFSNTSGGSGSSSNSSASNSRRNTRRK